MNYLEGKSGVNVRRLVQNIADQYPFPAQKAAVIELIANSLDAKATEIRINFDNAKNILEVEDNGLGMSKDDFREYHDFAASTKQRGSGIGFAGQGAKLALNFCSKVVSETHSTDYRGYSEWFLKGNDAPFRIYDNSLPSLNHHGTKITLYLDNNSSNYYSEDLIKDILYEHYFPLIDLKLNEIYKNSLYPAGIAFFINNKLITNESLLDKISSKKGTCIKVYRKNAAAGIFGILEENNEFLPGVQICTFGKVIERTFFKKEPINKEKIFGWIEAPYLIEAVTTDKCRFQAGNKVWEKFYLKAQKEFTDWLLQAGLLHIPDKKERKYISLEKEINSILKNMPELADFSSLFIEKQKTMIATNSFVDNLQAAESEETIQSPPDNLPTDSETPAPPPLLPETPPTTPLEANRTPTAESKKIIRGRIQIGEIERPDLDKEYYFDSGTVFINKSHPAYQKSHTHAFQTYHMKISPRLPKISNAHFSNLSHD